MQTFSPLLRENLTFHVQWAWRSHRSFLQEYPWRTDRMMRVIEVRDGPVHVEIRDGDAFEVRSEETFVIPSWQLFRHRFPPGSTREVRGAVFRFQLMDGLDPFVGRRFPRVLRADEAGPLLAITDRLSDCHEVSTANLADLIEYRRLGLDLLERLAAWGEPMSGPNEALQTSARLQPAMRMMEATMERRPDVASLATACGMSRSSFINLFSQTYGVAPMQFYRRLRLERAQRLLVATDLPLSSIAQQLGYADQAHFTREFKSAIHTSPISYRKAMSRTDK